MHNTHNQINVESPNIELKFLAFFFSYVETSTEVSLSMYGCPIHIINANAIANKHEPNRSPSAVKNGMAELSGSILYFHIKWIKT